MIEWGDIKHFKQKEFDDALHPGSGEKIDMKLVLNLDYLWERIAEYSDTRPVILITQAVDMLGQHGHSDDSYHLYKNKCQAADFIIFSAVDVRTLYFLVEKQGFGGIGVYYDWKFKNKPVPIGFHVDLRLKEQTQRWKRVNGQYMYLLGRR